MANELTRDDGISVSFEFVFQDAVAGTTNVMTLPGGGAGFKVPTGYNFHAVALHGESDTDLTAGTITFKVRDDGTALANGPTAVLSDEVQVAVGVQRVGADPIAAGSIVSVEAVASGALAPSTCGLDAVLVGILLPD